MQTFTDTTDTEMSIRALLPNSPDACFRSLVPDYALLFFDHLYSEYLALESRIKDQELRVLLNSLHAKRVNSQLSWSDIYTFDLALIDERPLENLIRKAYDARAKYRSIAGQKEFDEYLASKPPDLTAILIAPTPESSKTAEPAEVTSPPQPTDPPEPTDPSQPAVPPKSSEIVQRVLRADIRYLLSKFYLYYAMLPMRENLREQLTSRAVRMTKWILFIIVLLIVASFAGVLLLERVKGYGELTGAFGLTVGSVAFAGIVGGCVSMLQRIQSAPSEGDALFNLASLTYGWRGLSLSPLYGGIFASLLFVLFAAGILEGTVFPKIKTPGKIIQMAQNTSSPPVVETATQETPSGASDTAVGKTTSDKTVIPTPTPVTETEKLGILQIKDFLKETGPTDGVSFALLIIWSFIAGFAERLVPDTLNRLVAKNEALQGTNG